MVTYYLNKELKDIKLNNKKGVFYKQSQMNIHKKLPLMTLLILSIVNITQTQQWYEHGNPHFINEEDFERLVINPQTRNKGVTILKFFTPWCRYCKYLKDIIDDLRARDSWAITIYEVNCDQVNHYFCGKMGVHSFPKMKVFQNGNLMDNMDGFYPYQVVKELFLRYNRTHHVPEPAFPVPQIPHQQHQQEHTQQTQQENNYVEPQVIVPQNQNNVQVHNNQAEQNNPQQPQQPKPQQISDHHAQQPKTPQPPKQQQSVSNNNNVKKTQQMIEEEENIAIMDQDIKEAQKEKKMVEQIQKQTVDTIDLTKILPGEQHIQYGKYIIYAICIFVGGYYFVHIMRAQPVSEPVKPHNQQSTQSTDKSVISQIPNRVSIEDSQLREELHFQHPNEEEVNFNSMQIRDEDL